VERKASETERFSSIQRWQRPLRLRTPNGTGAKAPSKSANGSRADRRWGGREQGAKAPAAARNQIAPFPFPLRGKPGREGSPHAAKSAAPPTRGLRPLVNPPRKKSAGVVDRSRPSHGSRDRQGAVTKSYLVVRFISSLTYSNRLSNCARPYGLKPVPTCT
jgi:hypothetical protein